MNTVLNLRIGHYLERLSILLLIVALAMGTIGCTADDTGEPTEIWNWNDLNAIGDNLEGGYVLMSHLDDATDGYDELVGDTVDGKGWQPIGTTENPFKGTFDGNGNTISGLFIYRPDEDEVGLFGRVQEGLIKDVGLVSVNVTGRKSVGALLGYSWKGTLDSNTRPPSSKTYAHGSVTGEEDVGGLVGNNYRGILNQCESSVEVFHLSSTPDEERWRAGGLVGLNSGPVINCNYNGEVNGDRQVGGLVGQNAFAPDARVEDCGGEYGVYGNLEVGGVAGRNLGALRRASFNGTVRAFMLGDGLIALSEGTSGSADSSDTTLLGSYVGGVVGVNEGIVEDCSAQAAVEGYRYVGGLTGTNNGTVEGCSAHATVKGHQYVGGLAGANAGDLESCNSSGDVTGSSDAGQLVGYNMVTGTVSNSDSASCVTGAIDCGNLVGLDEAGASGVGHSLHFTCYWVDQETVPYIREIVYLEDQFGALEAELGWPWYFCNPTEKWDNEVLTPISNPDHHLIVYSLAYQEEPKEWFVEINNQFGAQQLTLWGPIALAVPTQKVEPLYHEPPVGLDHFLLYEVAEGPPVDRVVQVNDEFGYEEVLVSVPVYFANPARKTHDYQVTAVVNPDAHVVLYSIQGEYFEAEVQVVNQFGGYTFHVSGPSHLAIVSEMVYYEPIS